MFKKVVRVRTLLFLIVTLTLAVPYALLSRPAQADDLPWRDKGSPFGVVAALGNRVRSDEIDEAVALMREAGVQWQREEIFWDRVQQYPGGPYNWTGDGSGFYNYDYAIQAQVHAGINILGLLDYNPAWFKGKNPHPDEWIDDWGDFVYNTVARYGRDRGWIKHWELWNEPNLSESGYESGLYEIKDFVRLLEVGRAAAKAADPEAQIVMGGLASVWGLPNKPHTYDYYDYLLAVADLGGWDHVDILAFHLYRPDPPEGMTTGRGDTGMDLRTELDHLDEFLRQYGPKPVWVTEIGWATNTAWPGVDADTQAFYLVRTYVLSIAHPSVEKVFWYDFRNDTDPYAPYHNPHYDHSYNQYHFGLLNRRYPLNPHAADLRKPAFLAYRTMTQMLGNVSLQEVVAAGYDERWPGVFWYRFASGVRNVDVLWRINDQSPDLTVECGCREAMVRSWNGQMKQLIYADNGKVTFHLESIGTPMYVEYDPPVPEEGVLFEATGHKLRGAFHDFWERHGGMFRFGNPLTDEIIEPEAGTGRPRVVQYFDGARFEHHPEHTGTPYEVYLGNPGQALLAQQGVNWYELPQVTEVPTGTLLFEETGHSVQPPFQSVWEYYGGVPLMGYPLTEPFIETRFTVREAENRTVQRKVLVQYFERARLEHFPEHQGTFREVQFAPIIRELMTSRGKMR